MRLVFFFMRWAVSAFFPGSRGDRQVRNEFGRLFSREGKSVFCFGMIDFVSGEFSLSTDIRFGDSLWSISNVEQNLCI